MVLFSDDVNVNSGSVQIYACIHLTYSVWPIVVSRQCVQEVKFNKLRDYVIC